MPAFLLDTNVLSEIRKGSSRATPTVWKWWVSVQDQELFLSVMTLGEIRKGIDRLVTRDQAQALVLERWLEEVRRSFKTQVIDITPAIADRWGRLQALRAVPAVDALLAASALHHDLILVTRNEVDFDGMGVRVMNPFSNQ